MLGRRNLFNTAAAMGSAAAGLFGGRSAEASSKLAFDIEPRGTLGRLERLPTLDLESRDDFIGGFRTWGYDKVLGQMERNRFNMLIEDAGIDPDATDVSVEEVLAAVEHDPLLGTGIRFRIDVQDIMYRDLDRLLSSDADAYLEEMEAYDNIGPGTLELNPDMDIPIYTKYEIHCQPGGYVGHPLAGHLYYYGTNTFYMALKEENRQDQQHALIASGVPVPKDGKVLRILDLGCSVGQLAVCLKERFPDAEVWGVDIGGPMVRFGHMRAVDLGVEVHLAQRLAEDTKFPDNHFDMVTSYILHHEVPAQATIDISKEVHRILRPGGIYVPYDFYTGSKKIKATPQYLYGMWKDHRWNHEVWREEYRQLDFTTTFEEAGLEVNEDGPAGWRFPSNFLATKPA